MSHATLLAARRRGFTLIEAMVTVAVVAIMAGIAYPSFSSNLRKARRADAADAATAVLQAQERWRANNATYTANLANLNVPATSGGGYYALGLSAVTAAGYTLAFTPVAGKGQSDDSGCTAMTVVVTNGSAAHAPAACWSR